MPRCCLKATAILAAPGAAAVRRSVDGATLSRSVQAKEVEFNDRGMNGSGADVVRCRSLTFAAPRYDWFGCCPALCGNAKTQATIKIASKADVSGRLSARPPSATGLSRKSPTVAPSGRDRIKAAQNSSTRETFGPKIAERRGRKAGGEDERAAFIAEAGVVGGPVAERRAERLREA